MKVLSLFDGISAARQAMKELNINVSSYYASEISPEAVKVARNNHPDIIHIGDITEINFKDYTDIDLLIGGPPCQDLSGLNKEAKGLEGDKSSLFYYYLEALKSVKPRHFIMENVASMSIENKNKISDLLETEPVLINSDLLTAQSRPRLYWTSFKTVQPQDKQIMLSDILESGCTEKQKAYCLTATYHKVSIKNYLVARERQLIIDGGQMRKLTALEMERLQGFPDNYTAITPPLNFENTCKCLGNSFTVPVIKHLLECMQGKYSESSNKNDLQLSLF